MSAKVFFLAFSSLLTFSSLLIAFPTLGEEPKLRPITPLVRTVDLNLNEEQTVELHDGSQATVKLLELKEQRDPIRLAVRKAELKLLLNGEEIHLETGTYRLPQTIAGLQIDCTATKGLNSNGTPSFWGLDKDVRLRLWPKESDWIRPGTFIYPVKQGWLATRTWFDNEPVDGGKTIRKQIYYHSGLDIGATEDLTEVIAATDAQIVQLGTETLPEHGEGTPTSPRYDVLYLLDGRGWYYRYSHLAKFDPELKLGQIIKQGTRLGWVGKEGASGGWSHLHFEIKSQQPSGKWGTQAGFAFLHQAEVTDNNLQIYALARPAHFIVAGEEANLDGSRSWSRNDIQSYEWQLHDGTTASGAKFGKYYPTPGTFTELLKVTDSQGNISWDVAHIMVLDPNDLEHYSPSLNVNYSPTENLKTNEPITFKVRGFNMQGGKETWDFGDGSPKQFTQSPENAKPLAPEGYAKLLHQYEKPGTYIVTITRTHNNGQTATTKLVVTVK